jgi:nocturnin
MKPEVSNVTFDMTKLRDTLELAELKAAESRAAIIKARDSAAIVCGQERRKCSTDHQYVPPKQLLQYLVRMGSFTSSPALVSPDSQDAELLFLPGPQQELLERCEQELKELPSPLLRRFRQYSGQNTNLNLEKSGKEETSSIRLMQWNHLSQTLGTKNDKFIRCPAEALVWETRRWRLLHEILRYAPDIICLQEVDHFSLLERALGSVGYSGRFVPKPDSPCIYLPENNGPDGCAIFYKNSKFSLISESKRVLEVWRVQSNQVVLCLNLKHDETGQDVYVATTHLKARQGALLSTMRNEQGKDMLDWLAATAAGKPLLLSGDFNADPSEPVYQSVVHHAALNLSSAYQYEAKEDDFTTWKIRETGEQKYVLDYIFHTEFLTPTSVLEMPSEEEIGEDRLPSLRFPSDHLSLVADFSLV